MAKSSPDPQPGGDGNGPMFLVRGRAMNAASPKKPKKKTVKGKALAKARTRRAEQGGDGNGPPI